MNWTTYKLTPGAFTLKQQHYKSDTEPTYYVTPRRPMVSRAWGKGQKRSKSQVIYDVVLSGRRIATFHTARTAKKFAEDHYTEVPR